KAQGREVGNSLCEEAGVEPAARVLMAGVEKVSLPVDLVAGKEFKADTSVQAIDGGEVPRGWMGLAIGPSPAERYADAIKDAGTVFWNGPMGAFELPPFAAGTRAVAAAMPERPAVTGGGGCDRAR